MRPALIAAASVVLVGAACELREITIAEPDDVIVAEVLLRADAYGQTAYLHRTSSAHGSARVFDATITVTDVQSGEVLRYEATADSLCLRRPGVGHDASRGTCYAAAGNPFTGSARAGSTQTLHISLADGRAMHAVTTVPGEFLVSRPAASVCHLPPMTRTELVWSRSAGAAVYLVQARMQGLREALRARGVAVDGSGPVTLTGISVTPGDTTMSFPDGIGLFDRFDDSLHPILLAISDGLPEGVTTELAIAALDLNYVNWIRGGTFNPSGTVRISSIDGDGIGVFGSFSVRFLEIHTSGGGVLPVCGAVAGGEQTLQR